MARASQPGSSNLDLFGSSDEGRRVYSVSELTRRIKGILETAVGQVWVEGEVSNLRTPTSGHTYFTIKDEFSQISAVLFRGDQRKLSLELQQGVIVQACGEVTVYERSGNYQIIVRDMKKGGKGSLQVQFEAIKRKLSEEGLFDESRKKPIPILPRHIGIITSPTGAAIRDILNVLDRRFPNVHVILAPVSVQGETAAPQIVQAVRDMNAFAGVDVLIVGRGGGSLEDLWCFNDEMVARAIAASGIPVISAVGHEIDFTISDMVADLRAPTPSAAAELVVGCKEAFEDRLADIKRRLGQSARERILASRNRLLTLSGSDVFSEPGKIVSRSRQKLDRAALSMKHLLSERIITEQQRLDDLVMRSAYQISRRRELARKDLRRLEVQLRALNPTAVLDRGYSITRDDDGNVIRKVADVTSGKVIKTTVSDGTIESEVRSSAPRKSRDGT